MKTRLVETELKHLTSIFAKVNGLNIDQCFCRIEYTERGYNLTMQAVVPTLISPTPDGNSKIAIKQTQNFNIFSPQLSAVINAVRDALSAATTLGVLAEMPTNGKAN